MKNGCILTDAMEDIQLRCQCWYNRISNCSQRL